MEPRCHRRASPTQICEPDSARHPASTDRWSGDGSAKEDLLNLALPSASRSEDFGGTGGLAQQGFQNRWILHVEQLGEKLVSAPEAAVAHVQRITEIDVLRLLLVRLRRAPIAARGRASTLGHSHLPPQIGGSLGASPFAAGVAADSAGESTLGCGSCREHIPGHGFQFGPASKVMESVRQRGGP